MMGVVIPLSFIVRSSPAPVSTQVAAGIGVVLKHEVDMAIGIEARTHGLGELGQDIGVSIVDDRMHRVQPEPIELVLLEPVERVVNEEIAHWPTLRAIEVDRRPPRRVMTFRKESRRVEVQIVSARSEVIVDDVQEHHELPLMGLVDETLEVVRCTIGAMGRKGEDAVITPVALALERRDGHQLERCHAHRREVIELSARAFEPALRRKAAEMRLVENRLSPWPPAPLRMLPAEG